jgi:hypothetical protein
MAALVHAPAFGRVGFGLLKRHQLGHFGVIQRIGLAHVAAGGEQVEPNFASLRALVKEEHDRLAPAKKRVAGAIERGMVFAFFEKLLTQALLVLLKVCSNMGACRRASASAARCHGPGSMGQRA